MKNDIYGHMVYEQTDVFDVVMSGQDLESLIGLTVDHNVDLQVLTQCCPDYQALNTWRCAGNHGSVEDFDRKNQTQWLMPASYKELDVAAHVLALCHTPEELQRAGQELLMFQERGLFDLLRWLVYLVDTMKHNNIVWGVGRGSSVASFVLYKLGVHRINSLYYDLDPAQFLR